MFELRMFGYSISRVRKGGKAWLRTSIPVLRLRGRRVTA